MGSLLATGSGDWQARICAYPSDCSRGIEFFSEACSNTQGATRRCRCANAQPSAAPAIADSGPSEPAVDPKVQTPQFPVAVTFANPSCLLSLRRGRVIHTTLYPVCRRAPHTARCLSPSVCPVRLACFLSLFCALCPSQAAFMHRRRRPLFCGLSNGMCQSLVALVPQIPLSSVMTFSFLFLFLPVLSVFFLSGCARQPDLYHSCVYCLFPTVYSHLNVSEITPFCVVVERGRPGRCCGLLCVRLVSLDLSCPSVCLSASLYNVYMLRTPLADFVKRVPRREVHTRSCVYPRQLRSCGWVCRVIPVSARCSG